MKLAAVTWPCVSSWNIERTRHVRVVLLSAVAHMAVLWQLSLEAGANKGIVYISRTFLLCLPARSTFVNRLKDVQQHALNSADVRLSVVGSVGFVSEVRSLDGATGLTIVLVKWQELCEISCLLILDGIRGLYRVVSIG